MRRSDRRAAAARARAARRSAGARAGARAGGIALRRHGRVAQRGATAQRGSRARARGRRGAGGQMTAPALAAKLVLARALAAVSRRRGGGTSAPGRLLLALEPDAVGTLGARLPRGSVLISATNGKTTTAALAACIFARAHIPLVHNRAGANMAGALAPPLLPAPRRAGRMGGSLGPFGAVQRGPDH